jgi:arylsulfatase A-like enzyme
LCGCTRRQSSEAPGNAAPSSLSTSGVPTEAPERRVVLDFVGNLDACAFGQHGILLDFGDPSMKNGLHPGSIARDRDEVVEHEGASWMRVRSRTVTVGFYWPASEPADASAYVELRIRGGTARAMAVAIDGKQVGSCSLARLQGTSVVLARATTPVTLGTGGHELALHFVGGPRASNEPLADIDWAHVATGEPGEPYAAPTRADVVFQGTVEGRSLQALSLRDAGFVRCSGWLPADAALETWLATVGGGDANVEARLLRDRRAPVVVGTARVSGGHAGWSPWSVPVTGLDGAGALASIELAVTSAGKGTRVLLGDPRLVVPGTPAMKELPTARGVVLVVLGSTSAKSLAPWGGSHAAPSLARIAASGTTFLSNRAVSSAANAVLASMLTGLPPRAHGLDDPNARMAKAAMTVEEACHQGGIATAMFTANPTTGRAFGFDRAWDAFVAHDPLEDTPASRVFEDAAAWIEQRKGDRFFVVVHARGGHPPWDANPEELKAMPPEGYLGMIEPRRAAEALAKARKHPARFKEDDRVRAWGLYDHALDAQDQDLGRFAGALSAAGRDEDTVWIVTADVGATEGSVPFVDGDTLDESVLSTPLVVRWPGAGVLSGRRVAAPTSSIDIARTILAALGLAPPGLFQGADLASVARGDLALAERPLVATRAERFAVRWGPFVLMGSGDRESRMCDLSLDPTCVADVRATSPLALEPLHRWTIDALAPGDRHPSEPVVLDEHAAEALVRWGVGSGDRGGEER